MRPVRYTETMIRRYMEKGWWSRQTLVGVWEKNARLFPDREAIVDQSRRLTWAGAVEEVDRMACGMVSLGIGRDEVVVGQVPNVIESVTLRLAMEKAGILYLPGAMVWREKEAEHILATLKATAVVAPWQYEGFDYGEMYRQIAGRLPYLKHLVFWGPGAPAGSLTLDEIVREGSNPACSRSVSGRTYSALETSSISTSSGTTGLPKVVESATAPTLLFGRVVADRLGINGEDTVASIGPVNWGPGIGAVYSGAPQRGARIVLLERFDPEAALALIEKERVTVAAGSTAQLVSIVRSPSFQRERLSSLRAFYWAGAPLAYSIAREAEEKTDCKLVSAYGAMDAGYFACGSVEDSPMVRNLTVGKPLEGNDAVICDSKGKRVPRGEIGEIWFRGANCFPGYFRDEKAARQAWGKCGLAGWYRTGDVGQMDSEGNIRVLGRIRDVLQCQGNPVYPAEIENALLSHPALKSAAVVGVPDGAGQKCVAFVIFKPGQKLEYAEMSGYLRTQGLAEFKIPARLEIKETFPMSGDGLKISKKDLEAEAGLML